MGANVPADIREFNSKKSAACGTARSERFWNTLIGVL